jgi:hypothetical protein
MSLLDAELHVLTNEQTSRLDQADKVPVGEHRQHLHLHQELLPSLHYIPRELLHHHVGIKNALQEQ